MNTTRLFLLLVVLAAYMFSWFIVLRKLLNNATYTWIPTTFCSFGVPILIADITYGDAYSSYYIVSWCITPLLILFGLKLKQIKKRKMNLLIEESLILTN